MDEYKGPGDEDAGQVAEAGRRFADVLNEMEATPGVACGAAVTVWQEAIQQVPEAERQEIYLQVITAIKPVLN